MEVATNTIGQTPRPNSWYYSIDIIIDIIQINDWSVKYTVITWHSMHCIVKGLTAREQDGIYDEAV